jgi:hypothetical protein
VSGPEDDNAVNAATLLSACVDGDYCRLEGQRLSHCWYEGKCYASREEMVKADYLYGDQAQLRQGDEDRRADQGGVGARRCFDFRPAPEAMRAADRPNERGKDDREIGDLDRSSGAFTSAYISKTEGSDNCVRPLVLPMVGPE